MRVAKRRRYQLRDGSRWLGSEVEAVLERPQMQLNDELRLTIKDCVIGLLLVITSAPIDASVGA